MPTQIKRDFVHFFRPMRRMASYKAAILLMAGLAVMGCNAVERFMRVGNDVAVGPLENPTHRRGYRPISMPMPKPKIVEMRSNSLWRQGSRAFFKDLRASEIGDVITVVINIADEAKLNNKSTQKRDDSSVSALNNVLGLESNLSKFLPGAVTGASLLNTSSDRNISGAGSIERKETINLKVAAVVTQILPNGNLVIHGRQETSINFEVRELQVAGVIRPEDVSSANTIKYEQIAEARVVYGGRGSISDLQRPRWGSEIVDVLLPF